jgi:hypothetical protein
VGQHTPLEPAPVCHPKSKAQLDKVKTAEYFIDLNSRARNMNNGKVICCGVNAKNVRGGKFFKFKRCELTGLQDNLRGSHILGRVINEDLVYES